MRRPAVLLLAALALNATPAYAQKPTTVTLNASRQEISFGRQVRLSGVVSPAAADQPVAIVDENGRVRTEVLTDADGRFAALLRPKSNASFRAKSADVSSESVTVRVRPILKIKLSRARLFGRSRVVGTLRPIVPSSVVTVTLKQNGSSPASRKLPVKRGGRFSGRLMVTKPGRVQAVASFRDGDHLPAKAWSNASETPFPRLGIGARGVFVKLLEKRLDSLGYFILRIDRRYDNRTSDAVIAFNKVERRARVGSVDESTWRALASPKIAPVRFSKPRSHIEVDQTRQVLYFVKRGKVTEVVHVSTGAGGGTHDGSYTFFRDIAGYSAGRLYYPTYFDGLRAIHGWPEVPTYAASHGCVRVPMWAAQWIHDHVKIGQRIFIYH